MAGMLRFNSQSIPPLNYLYTPYKYVYGCAEMQTTLDLVGVKTITLKKTLASRQNIKKAIDVHRRRCEERFKQIESELCKRYLEGESIRCLKKDFKTSFETIREILTKNNIKIRNVSEARHLGEGKNIDLSITPNLCYILGVCYGDGSVYKAKRGIGITYCVALQVRERDFAESFYISLREIGLTPTFCQKKHSNSKDKCANNYSNNYYWYVLTSNKKFYDFFKLLSLNEISKICNISSEHAIAFLRGIYESEGGYYKKSTRGVGYVNAITNTNKDLCELVLSLCSRLGFKVRMRKSFGNIRHGFAKGKIIVQMMYYVRILGGNQEYLRFLELINPCIKKPQLSECRYCSKKVIDGYKFCSRRCARKYYWKGKTHISI
jgi:intein-encoded DNA endonuclease-like protein